MTPADVLPADLRLHLEGGMPEDRIMLANLAADGRLADDVVASFRMALESGTRLQEACWGGGRSIRAERSDAATLGSTWYVHTDEPKLRRRHVLDAFGGTAPAAGDVPLTAEFYERLDGAWSLWTTPFSSADPDEVVARLGLGYWEDNRRMFRVPVEIESEGELFIPSVLDAEAAWYWRYPTTSAAKGCGQTMDLRDCSGAEPELIVTLPATRGGLAEPVSGTAAAAPQGCRL